jgi:hypothetical protein
MPRISQKWKSDSDRCRYYKLRAEKIEMELAEKAKHLIPVKTTDRNLRAFCAAIAGKIRSSPLEASSQTELFDDLADLPHRLSVNGKARSTRRGRRS